VIAAWAYWEDCFGVGLSRLGTQDRVGVAIGYSPAYKVYRYFQACSTFIHTVPTLGIRRAFQPVSMLKINKLSLPLTYLNWGYHSRKRKDAITVGGFPKKIKNNTSLLKLKFPRTSHRSLSASSPKS